MTDWFSHPTPSLETTLDLRHAANLVVKMSCLLKGRVWARYTWHDRRLAYDPSEFGGIKPLGVDPALIWFPDITLYNR